MVAFVLLDRQIIFHSLEMFGIWLLGRIIHIALPVTHHSTIEMDAISNCFIVDDTNGVCVLLLFFVLFCVLCFGFPEAGLNLGTQMHSKTKNQNI